MADEQKGRDDPREPDGLRGNTPTANGDAPTPTAGTRSTISFAPMPANYGEEAAAFDKLRSCGLDGRPGDHERCSTRILPRRWKRPRIRPSTTDRPVPPKTLPVRQRKRRNH